MGRERILYRETVDDGFKEITTAEEAAEIKEQCVFYTMKSIDRMSRDRWLLIKESDLANAIANTPIGYEATAMRKCDLRYVATVSGGYIEKCSVGDTRKENHAFIRTVKDLQCQKELAMCSCMDENSNFNV